MEACTVQKCSFARVNQVSIWEDYLIELELAAVAEPGVTFGRIAQTFIVEISSVDKTVFTSVHE
jgi:hypothetical protein